MTSSSERPRPGRLVFNASYIARAHTYLAFAAFLGALFLGCALHYKKIVKNGVAGYPEEWFPSVSATIGDWYPERNIFQILIALNSGPRLASVFLQYYLHRKAESSWPGFVMLFGVLRTLSCGGWVYITSTDDHDAHDVLMISYIVFDIPWMFGSIACTPVQNIQARRRRRIMATAFFGSMIPMVYFFIQHKVHRIPGAYTRYSFFEWALILFDVMYDSSVELELRATDLKIGVGVSLENGSEKDDIVVAPGGKFARDAIQPREPSETSSYEKNAEQGVERTDVQDPAKDVSLPRSVLKQARPMADFLSDVYLSFIYWSIFTSLTPTFFYFSVWELSFAGHEASLLFLLSPVLLGIPSFSEWCRSHSGRTILHILSLAGLVAYALDKPIQRLLVVVFATSVINIGAAVDWTSGDQSDVGYQAMLLGVGFIVSSIVKHANHSNIPVWPIVNEQSGGYNKTGIALACFAIYNFATRSSNSLIRMPPSTQAKTKAEVGEKEASDSWLPIGFAFGTLMFTLHNMLADPSTLIAWSWTGYPIRGPMPHLHGSLTHIAQAVGLCLPIILTGIFANGARLLLHPLWFAYGGASAYVVYAYKDWLGYTGGLNFAVFLMSILPPVLQRVTATGQVAKTLCIAWLVVSLLYVVSTFTVAYAFVPGGEYLRERTDLVFFGQMVALALAFQWPRTKYQTSGSVLTRRAKYFVSYSLAVLSVSSFLVTLYRMPAIPRPHRPGARIIRAGIWTVHFGIDNEGRDSQRRMRDLIKDMELDVVGLLETDLHRPVFGNRDLTRVMAEELGFFVDLGPGPNMHTWGAVLLSKFPIVNSTHHLLPSPHGELAPAIEAVLDVYGTQVVVVIAHNGQEETPLDRELQARELARIMSSSYPQPVIFLGYVVTKPLATKPAPYEIMVADGRVNDIDEQDWDRWCEYIFYRGLYRTAYARVSRSTITDTELQIGQFVVPKYGVGVTDDSHEALYLRAWKEELPEEHWFPLEYYPEQGGKRGHHYHVFNTPLYYKIPEGAIL
ncbi:hypothetical protein AcW1_008492 [Taiwanofungus camphoratus]|nr:hypothetical protein AcV5_008782 [Antrodia cinnamomea]KAI0951450.1 hypothetical protein AcW1_008492 [Antrodia cinnamomea]